MPRSRTDTLLRTVAWACVVVVGLFIGLVVLGIGGVMTPTLHRDLANSKPFSDYIGREYRVVSEVRATAWNDFPDKEKILTVALGPPYGGSRRFMSWERPLELGQEIRIVGASSYLSLDGWVRSYLVQVPGAGLPEGVPTHIRIGRDGLLDSRLYEPAE
jgi:hypothetical protein